MLEVATQKNNLKDGYCFKSVNSEVISTKSLEGEMKDFNSTLTEVDAQAAMSVMGKMFVKHLARGEKIVLPFGTFRAIATGTCENPEDTFSPGTGDNKVAIVFEANQACLSEIQHNLQYKIVPYMPASNANIVSMSVSNNDGGKAEELTVKTGKPATLKGFYLLFDSKDEKQGVFLKNGETSVRVTEYFQKLRETVVFFVPETLPAGEYEVTIVTKPRKDTYTKSTALEMLKVIA